MYMLIPALCICHRSKTGSQCRCARIGEMWSYFRTPGINLATAFCTWWSSCVVFKGSPTFDLSISCACVWKWKSWNCQDCVPQILHLLVFEAKTLYCFRPVVPKSGHPDVLEPQAAEAFTTSSAGWGFWELQSKNIWRIQDWEPLF